MCWIMWDKDTPTSGPGVGATCFGDDFEKSAIEEVTTPHGGTGMVGSPSTEGQSIIDAPNADITKNVIPEMWWNDTELEQSESLLFKINNGTNNPIAMVKGTKEGKICTSIAMAHESVIGSRYNYTWQFSGNAKCDGYGFKDNAYIGIKAPEKAGKYTLTVTLINDKKEPVNSIERTVYVTYGGVVTNDSLFPADGVNDSWLKNTLDGTTGTAEDILAKLNIEVRKVLRDSGFDYDYTGSQGVSRNFPKVAAQANAKDDNPFFTIHLRFNCSYAADIFRYFTKILGINTLPWGAPKISITNQDTIDIANVGIIVLGGSVEIKKVNGQVDKVYIFGSAPEWCSPGHDYSIYDSGSKITSYDTVTAKNGPGKFGAIYAILAKIRKKSGIGYLDNVYELVQETESGFRSTGFIRYDRGYKYITADEVYK